jgi:hypothetical protein
MLRTISDDKWLIVDKLGNPQIGSGDFFKSLGQYVYAYYDDDGQPIYIGKGNGNRGVQHIKTKGYDLDKLYIIAKNLERFEDKDDFQSFLLESFLIAKYEPIDNKVSGHYKECFIMKSFDELFTTFEAEQYDNFATFPEWYTNNYEKFSGSLGVVTIKKDNTYLESVAKSGITMSWYTGTDDSVDGVLFTLSASKMLEQNRSRLFIFLSNCGYEDDEIEPVGDGTRTDRKYRIAVDGIDRAIEIFNALY